MPAAAPHYIEPISFLKLVWIAIPRDDAQNDKLSPANDDISKDDIRHGRPEEGSRQTGIAKQFLNSLFHQLRKSMQKPPLFWMAR
jgi:hypothetical protein